MAKITYPDKLKLVMGPTPIQRMRFLSEKASKFGDVNVYVKRDDLNHGPASGNKIRKLEFLLADAKAKGADIIMTCGGIQSNHARATAILARELGMDCVLFLRGEKPQQIAGNLFLDLFVGARVIFVDEEQYLAMTKLFHSTAESYRALGKRAIAIAEGGSSDLGVAGYVVAMEEISQQCGHNLTPKRFDSIVCAVGSGGTYAGLVLGRNLLGWDDEKTTCIGFNICKTSKEFEARVTNLMIGAVQRMRWPISFMAEDIKIIDGYVGPGYAQTTLSVRQFMSEVACTDGLLLDPVYTGKAMYGLISECTKNTKAASVFGKNVLFIHTGGVPALLAHQEDLVDAIK